MKQHENSEEREILKEEETEKGQQLPEEGGEEKAEKKPKAKKKTKEQELAAALEETREQMLRVMAEYDNYRKRTEKEKQGAVSLGTALAIERLLPVLDTLEMAVAVKTSDADYKKGVELTAGIFRTAMESLGVSEIEAEGKAFDPNIHNCVASEESDGYESGMVIRVLQKGYKLNDRVLRPSMVAVSA